MASSGSAFEQHMRGAGRSNCFPTFHRRENSSGMTIKKTDGIEVALGTSEMRELFRFLLHHARDFENTCCWNGCLHAGKPYKVKRTHLNTTRLYCDQHAFAAELAGFIVNPMFGLATGAKDEEEIGL